MKANLSFQGIPILYKTFNNQKEIGLEFSGITLADLIKGYDAPVKKALLSEPRGQFTQELPLTLESYFSLLPITNFFNQLV